MTKPSSKDIYRFHVSNLREIQNALDRTALVVREAIGRAEQARISSFTKLYALLLGAWAECRLQKLLHEPTGFTAVERQSIRKKRKQFPRWQEAIKYAFRKQYRLRKASFSALDHSAAARFKSLMEMPTKTCDQ